MHHYHSTIPYWAKAKALHKESRWEWEGGENLSKYSCHHSTYHRNMMTDSFQRGNKSRFLLWRQRCFDKISFNSNCICYCCNCLFPISWQEDCFNPLLLEPCNRCNKVSRKMRTLSNRIQAYLNLADGIGKRCTTVLVLSLKWRPSSWTKKKKALPLFLKRVKWTNFTFGQKQLWCYLHKMSWYG